MPSSVVLPAPLCPSSAHIERAVSSRLTPASARSLPKRFATFAIWTESMTPPTRLLSPEALELGEHLLAARRILARAVDLDELVEQRRAPLVPGGRGGTRRLAHQREHDTAGDQHH